MHIILFGRGVSSKNHQQNLQHLKTEVTIQEIKGLPKATYEKLIKKRIKENFLNIF